MTGNIKMHLTKKFNTFEFAICKVIAYRTGEDGKE
jgi:hypothetical protein